jgi:hypothetical protein
MGVRRRKRYRPRNTFHHQDETSTMISLRRSAVPFALLGVLGSTLTSCDRGVDSPTRPIAASAAASFSKKPHGAVDTRVLVDKTGLATIEFRTGMADDATNAQIPDGHFHDIEYKVYDLSGKEPKEILNRKINFTDKGPELVSYAQIVPSRNGETKINDKPPKPDKKDAKEIGPLSFDPSYRVIVKAHINGLAADPKPDIEVRDTADIFFNPDLDLTASKVQKFIAGPPSSLVDLPAQVQIGVPQAYQVQFFNNPGAGATVGGQVTCEVHVFAGAVEVAPALTFLWLPNGPPPFDATITGSNVSGTMTIPPNNTAACRFTMALPNEGVYRIQVRANPTYPSDFDPANNEVSGVVTAITGSPIDPSPGGFGANATADDYYFTGFDLATGKFAPFLGDSAQHAQIEKLSSTIVTNSGLSGDFELKVNFSTIDTVGGGSLISPTGTRTMATATWTGSLPGIVTAAASAPNNCVSSDGGFGAFTATASNNNHLEALICIVETTPTQLTIGTTLRWRPISDPPAPTSAASGAQFFGDYLIWHTDLKLTGFPRVNPVSDAPVALSGGPYTAAGSGGDVKPCFAFFPTRADAVKCSFSTVAQARIHRFR